MSLLLDSKGLLQTTSLYLIIKKSDFPSYLKSALTKNNVIYDHRYDFDKLEIKILNILNTIINKQKNGKTKKNKSKKNKTKKIKVKK